MLGCTESEVLNRLNPEAAPSFRSKEANAGAPTIPGGGATAASPTLRRRPSLSSGASAILAPALAPRVSAPGLAVAFSASRRGCGSSSRLAAAAASAPSTPDPTPSPAEDEVERAKLAQVLDSGGEKEKI
ncbi:hypothetical protein GUJ93_ZPchr0012g21167 [Zizania palustris]|uniref:Uncharacterized protein n=1 Tax=Zizania palustris TaxID=103762 RepID=A0A8J5WTE8_ZIZPA|nr:hypothetical protein GUJ93_ZPchr0012g21167 [Zizania palustris]